MKILVKICSNCGDEKSFSEFYKQKDCINEISSICKDCKRIYNQTRYLKNKNKILKKSKEWKIKNKDKVKKSSKNRYLNNKEKILKQTNEYYHSHKIQYKQLREKNKNKFSFYQKEYRLQNINFKLAGNLRNRMVKILHNINKSASTMNLLGCSIEDLKKHLESQFIDGMSWSNYGLKGWHIDHIRPCASFDLTDPKQQEQCFHYSNLQPLWWIDNLKKGTKYSTL